jgi:protein gp37
VFCASLADVFEARVDLLPWRRDLFDLIDRCPSLDFLLLTKRPENIGSMWRGNLPRENVWLGTSIANQRNAEEDIDRLAEWRDLAPILFLSVEPQIGPVSLSRWLGQYPRVIDWVITGGESHKQRNLARRYDMNWARELAIECAEAEVPLFVKQVGSNAWDGAKKLALRHKKGGDMEEWSPGIRIRQCPESYGASV